MPGALLTTYLSDYRLPLYRLLAERAGIEILCYGRGERYAPPWFRDLDGQLARAPFPARRIDGGVRDAIRAGREHDVLIAPFAGGAMLPAAYLGARRFLLWASVWAWPRSPAHDLSRPAIRHIYRHADAVVTYGEHVRSFVAAIRGRDDDVIVAPQSVEPELFAVPADPAPFRAAHGLEGPLVLYVGRLVAEKGVEVLAAAWPKVRREATLVVIGDGPLRARLEGLPRTRVLGPLPRPQLPAAYAAAELTVVPSVPTPRFREPWGLVCNESMHQGTPVVASDAVGAVAGGLVTEDNGRIVPAGDPGALADAIDTTERARLGDAARAAVAPYTPEAQYAGFARALALTLR